MQRKWDASATVKVVRHVYNEVSVGKWRFDGWTQLDPVVSKVIRLFSFMDVIIFDITLFTVAMVTGKRIKVMIHGATLWAVLPSNVGTFPLRMSNNFLYGYFRSVMGNFLRSSKQNARDQLGDFRKNSNKMAATQWQWSEEKEHELVYFYTGKLSCVKTGNLPHLMLKIPTGVQFNVRWL